jgi:small subunit ribosomal protein S16
LVKLRLRRIGRKKLPLYKIVAADSRAARDGRFIESLGNYDPNTNPAGITLKEERVIYWLKTGATPTYTVRNLLSRKGIMLKLDLGKKGADEHKINDELSKWSAMQETKIRKENEKKLRRRSRKKKTKTSEAAEKAAQPAPEASGEVQTGENTASTEGA